MKEIYKHHATDEELELEIFPQSKDYKVGVDSNDKKYRIFMVDRRWQIKGTSFFFDRKVK